MNVRINKFIHHLQGYFSCKITSLTHVEKASVSSVCICMDLIQINEMKNVFLLDQ